MLCQKQTTDSCTMRLLLLVMSLTAVQVRGVCYFPVEQQGMFAAQASTSDPTLHKYTTITVLPDAIPVWGVCQEKFGHHVLLYDKTLGRSCYRCLHLLLRSPNVIQIHAEPVDYCHPTLEDARSSCPSLEHITTRRAREIMLYKSRSFTREGSIERVFCPINGPFQFTYNVNDGTEAQRECAQPMSSLENCPRGSELQMQFQRCTFGDLSMSLRCLGNWKGYDGQNYLALWDSSVEQEDQPRYRCAMYDIDDNTGVVHLSFSVDATCTHQLHSPWEGYETMVLTPRATRKPPSEVKTHACVFPEWARGQWQHLKIMQNDVVLQDQSEDRVLQLECLSQHAPHGERYALFSRDQCGREEFTCIWIKKRAVNVIEFQMSKYPADHYNLTQTCADDVFLGQDWSTEGRIGVHDVLSCPIEGEHAGVLPDASDLCAQLTSDCSSPQRMHYTVTACANESQVFEEREYRCLGRWTEGGVTYTFTHRVDVNTYECFAGVVVNSKEIFIIEAGASCQRGMQPLAYGMKLVQRATCDELRQRSSTTTPLFTTSTTTTQPDRGTNSTEVAPPWWRTAPRVPWQRKPDDTTRKPYWKDQTEPQVSSALPRSHHHYLHWATAAVTVLLLGRRAS